MSRLLDCLMGPLTFANSQNEETDFSAERRWENEGEIPGNFSSHYVTIAKRRHHREAR